jgi:sugar lactone lactonase YvrE
MSRRTDLSVLCAAIGVAIGIGLIAGMADPSTASAAARLRQAGAGEEARSAPAAPPAPQAPSWQEVSHAGKVAHDAKDYAAYRAAAGRLVELLSGNPDTVFEVAKAEALLGHAAAALDWLNIFAGMGLVRDVAAEPDLASLRQQAGFAAVQARLAANRRPVAHAVPAFTLSDPELLAEDLGYDPARHRFFVSSIREAKIVAVDARSGAMRDFVPAGRDGIWGVLALAVDVRRGVLWASTAAMPQTLGYRPADLGHSAVLRYDLATGRLLQRYDLPFTPAPPRPAPQSTAQAGAVAATADQAAEDRTRVLGDMTVAATGEVYVSEAVTGAVYTIRRNGDALETLVPPGTFVSPQNPAVTPDGRRLLVADYVRGIGIVDLGTREVTWMAHPREVAVNGIDGMYLVGNSLIAVQNGTAPNRVIRLRLDAALTRVLRWEALESNSPGLGAPTHGTAVARDFFFLANSGWDQLSDDGAVKPGAHLTPAAVRRLAL